METFRAFGVWLSLKFCISACKKISRHSASNVVMQRRFARRMQDAIVAATVAATTVMGS